MSKLLNKKPLGYTEARYAEYDENKIVLDVACLENMEKSRFVLYNPQTAEVNECASTANAIMTDSVCAGINSGTEWLLCIQYIDSNEEKIEFLRCLECIITEEQQVEIYDKRELYGKPIITADGKVLLLSYGINGILKIEKCDNEKYMYMSQIMNEILGVNDIWETEEKSLVSVKCKIIKGNYIGIVPYEDTRDENIENKCIEYNYYYEADSVAYMNFEVPREYITKGMDLCMAWKLGKQIYVAPVRFKQRRKLAEVSKVTYTKDEGLRIDALYDGKLYGELDAVRLVRDVEQWEKSEVLAIEVIEHKYNLEGTFISLIIKDLGSIKDISTWRVEIHTTKDRESHVLELVVDDISLIGDIYDREDTKYKLSLRRTDDVLTINRLFGHNALFNKNIQGSKDISIDEFLQNESVELKGNMYGEYIEEEKSVRVRLHQYMADVTEARLVMYHTQGMGVLSSQELQVEDGKIKDFELVYPKVDWDDKFTKPIDSVWFRVALAIKTTNGIYLSMLSNYDVDTEIEEQGNIQDSRKLYFRPVANDSICNVNMTAVPYYASNKSLSMKLVRPERLYRSQFTNEILDVKIKKDIFTIKMHCRKIEGVYKGVVMEYRNVKEEEAETYCIPYDSLIEDGDFYIMTTKFDAKKYYMRMLYWDIRCAFEIDGKLYTVSCHSNNEKFLRKYKGVFVDRTYPNDNSIMFPFATASNSVALMHRETCPQDNWRFRLKEKFAQKLYKMFKKHWDEKNIYLIFEKYCTMAQDNGYFFFKYCMDANVEQDFDGEIYYVIDKAAADWEKVAPYKNKVLKYLSIKHMIYLQACKLMISTDTKGHAYVWRSMGSDIKALTYQKKLVFLQHGVTAFKRGHFERGTNVGCESFITTSQFEHDIIRDYLEYPEEEIPITGFARWDVLHDKSEGHREILMMPTWRTWLDDAENDVFAESDYCKNYMALLNDPRLDEILKKYDVTLNFYLHPKFRKFITEFSVVSENIRLIPFGEEPLNELMMECNLLITDFSSVAWDVYYMNKPVLFYHFDLDDAYKTLGFYMDMRNDIFGERAEEPEGLMQLIIEYIENGFQMKEKYSKDREKYFAYVDDNNSERIWKAIQEREW